MPDILLIWVSYALATALFSIWRLYIPIYSKLAKEHLLVRHRFISIGIWIVSTFVLAPFIVPSLIVEEYRQAYIDGFVLGSEDA